MLRLRALEPTYFAHGDRDICMDRNRGVLLALLVVFGALSILIVIPFVQYVLLALLLGYVCHPAHVRLAPRVGSRVAAVTLIVVAFLLIVLPFVAVLVVAVDQAANLVASIQSGAVNVGTVEALLLQYAGVEIDLSELIAEIDLAAALSSVGDGTSAAIVGNAAQLLGGLSNALIGLAIAAFLLFYVLTDGEQFVQWTYEVVPLSNDRQAELYAEIDQVTWAVLVGNLLVAVIQGVLTGIGLALVGVPNVIFWSFVTVALSLLPIIGAFVVWFPAALYLLVTGNFVGGVLLLVYGVTIVSLSDNYLRPVLVDRGAHLNPGVIILGLFGGVYALGFMGLFFGPVVLGVLKTLLVMLAKERGQMLSVRE